MKTKNVKLTINWVIEVMKPGNRYRAADLAAKLGVPPSSVRRLLATDAARACLDMESGVDGPWYSLAGRWRKPEAHVDTRIRPDLTSNLSGYVRGLDAHRALAMTTRGVR
ncbi:helix-turn-helix domain-containing protein [Burkholderia glumae]|uniref:helix-turn-helix domain-containing protein n=1 Tax=Burkholderia glumae TaxID=337 RepID=UPI00039FF96F|nr:helix-turn-helix domain-containing protein [Burkholderia glumae]